MNNQIKILSIQIESDANDIIEDIKAGMRMDLIADGIKRYRLKIKKWARLVRKEI